MAGQKLKKQKRYKEKQTQKENATHISTQETTTSIFPIEKDDKGKQKERTRRAKGTPAGNTPKTRHKLMPK